MTGKNLRKRHARTCPGKTRHATRQKALDALLALRRNTGAAIGGMVVYGCTACGLWHYGHRIGKR